MKVRYRLILVGVVVVSVLLLVLDLSFPSSVTPDPNLNDFHGQLLDPLSFPPSHQAPRAVNLAACTRLKNEALYLEVWHTQ